jgi:hypothetical protein
VSQDNVYAYLWVDVSSANGAKSASRLKIRDLIAKDMTPSQIEEAQKLARQCMKKEYKDC